MSSFLIPVMLWALITWATCLAICVAVRASFFPEVPRWRLLRNQWIDQYHVEDALRRFDLATTYADDESAPRP